MLSMIRQMHLWWAEAPFSIKCLGITRTGVGMVTVWMEFHWMRKWVL